MQIHGFAGSPARALAKPLTDESFSATEIGGEMVLGTDASEPGADPVAAFISRHGLHPAVSSSDGIPVAPASAEETAPAGAEETETVLPPPTSMLVAEVEEIEDKAADQQEKPSVFSGWFGKDR